MVDERVNVFIRARDAAGRILGRVARSIGQVVVVGNQAVELFGRLAGASLRAGARLIELVTRGGQVVGVQRAFTRVVGDSAAALGKLRQATQGLITNYDLMVGFNRAVTLGAARTVEEFGALADTAITLGRALGVDAAFALEKLSLGIGRQSKLFLDDLGIIISVEQANKQYAQTLGIVGRSLTDAEKREAFRTAALEAARQKIEQLGGTSTTNAERIRSVGTIFRNMVDDVSRKLAESDFLAGLLEKISNFAGNVATILTGQADDIRAGFAVMGSLAANAFSSALANGLLVVPELIKSIPILGRIAAGQFALSPSFRAIEGARDNARKNFDADLALLAGLAARVQNRPTTAAPGAPPGRPGRGGGELSLRERIGLLPLAASHEADPRRFVTGQVLPASLPLRPIAPEHVEQAEAFTDVVDVMGDRLDKAAQRTQEMGETVGSAFAQMATSAISGSQTAAQAVIGMISQIVASVPKLGIGGLIAGTVLGGIGSLFGQRSRDPLPTRLVTVDDRAARQLERVRQGPDRVTVNIVNPIDGSVLRSIDYHLRRRERQDGVGRIPVGITL